MLLIPNDHATAISETYFATILHEFSRHTIFNVAILRTLPNNELQCIFTFPYESRGNSLQIIRNPKILTECFPDKISNLNGHRLHFYAYSKRLRISGHTGSLTGIYSPQHLYIIKNLNATYEVETISDCFSNFTKEMDPAKHLVANRVAASEGKILSGRFDVIWLREPFQIGIIVTSMSILPMQHIANSRKLWTVSSFVQLFLSMAVFNRFFLDRRGWRLLKFNSLVFIAHSQSAPDIHRKTKKKGTRIFLGAYITYHFFVATYTIGYVTSKYIVYLPDRSTKTLEDVLDHKVPLKTESECIMGAGKYSRDQLGNYTLFNQGVLFSVRDKVKTAYLVELTMDRLMLNSANNVDETEQKKFYMLDELFVSLPAVSLLPANSPFTQIIRATAGRCFEAALSTAWSTQYFYLHQDTGSRFFPKLLYSKSEPRPMPMDKLGFLYTFMTIGLILSVLAFVVEHCVYRWNCYKERRNCCRMKKRERDKFLREIVVKYNHFLNCK